MSCIILHKEDALVGADLAPAYEAIKQDVVVSAMFKKKEDISKMAKSILKHRIQTLTGRNIKTIEEEMNYVPLDPNETGMNEQVLRKLAHCLILQASGELPPVASRVEAPAVPAPATSVSVVDSSRKRPANGLPAAEPKPAKTSRRSIAVSIPIERMDESNVGTPKRGRRSLAVIGSTPDLERPANPTPSRASRKNRLDESVSSEASVALRCPAPATSTDTKLAIIQDEEEEEEIRNPTPAMRELIQKRKSMSAAASFTKVGRSPVKAAARSPVKKAPLVTPPSPGPRPEFVGASGSRVYLMCGQPLELNLNKVRAALPLSANFPGAHLTVVHTPADWTPTELFLIGKVVKTINLEAGLPNFVLLIGTGLTNVHLNIEALKRHTQQVQFLTFHREDCNKDVDTGMLRETTSFFLVAYFFPGCETPDANPPNRMVRDTYTTCFRTDGIESLERSIIDCFSEQGEWLLDLCCGTRKLTLAAAEAGRSAVAVHHDRQQLEQLGDYLRTLSLTSEPTYRQKDGLVL